MLHPHLPTGIIHGISDDIASFLSTERKTCHCHGKAEGKIKSIMHKSHIQEKPGEKHYTGNKQEKESPYSQQPNIPLGISGNEEHGRPHERDKSTEHPIDIDEIRVIDPQPFDQKRLKEVPVGKYADYAAEHHKKRKHPKNDPPRTMTSHTPP